MGELFALADTQDVGGLAGARDSRRDRRVLWLAEGDFDPAFELELLIACQYEVYQVEAMRLLWQSESEVGRPDVGSGLSISEEEVGQLDEFDFSSATMNFSVKGIINKRFGIAMVSPGTASARTVLMHFHGRIIYRTTGALSNEFGFDNVSAGLLESGVDNYRLCLSSRIFYGNGLHIEFEPAGATFSTRRIYLPSRPRVQRKCINHPEIDRRHALFATTRGDSSPFSREFRELSTRRTHIQFLEEDLWMVPGSDETSIRPDVEQVLQSAWVLFDCTRSLSRVCQSAIHAMQQNVPVLALSGGSLATLPKTGERRWVFSSLAEAWNEAQRLRTLDSKWKQDLLAEQREFLSFFSHGNCVGHWRKGLEVVTRSGDFLWNRLRRLAVICIDDNEWNRAHSVRVAAGLKRAATQTACETDVVLGIVRGPDLPSFDSQLGKAGVKLRELSWSVVDSESARITKRFEGCKRQWVEPSYAVPLDDMADFRDCDYLFLVGSGAVYPVLGVRPYSVLVTDFTRHQSTSKTMHPWSERAFAETVRGADMIFCSSGATSRMLRSGFMVSDDRIRVRRVLSSAVSGRSSLARESEPRKTLFVLVGAGVPSIEGGLLGAVIRAVTDRKGHFFSQVVVFGPDVDAIEWNRVFGAEDGVRIERYGESSSQFSRNSCSIIVESGLGMVRWLRSCGAECTLWWPEWTPGGIEYCRAAAEAGSRLVAFRSSGNEELLELGGEVSLTGNDPDEIVEALTEVCGSKKLPNRRADVEPEFAALLADICTLL